MKKTRVLMLMIILMSMINCKMEDEQLLAGRLWKETNFEIVDQIQASRVVNSELIVVTEQKLYEISSENDIVDYDLESSKYPNTNSPELNDEFIFRIQSYDTILYLEFRPIENPSEAYQVEIRELETEGLIFPVNRVESNSSGKFSDNRSFLFAGYDYSLYQEFIVELFIDYNEATQQIENITIGELQYLTPNEFPWGGELPKIQDILFADDVFYICMGSGGLYIYEHGQLTYKPDQKFRRIFSLGQKLYAKEAFTEGLQVSSDGGLSWNLTEINIRNGKIRSEGDYVLVISEYEEIQMIGKDVESLEDYKFDLRFGDGSIVDVGMIHYLNGKYYLGKWLYDFQSSKIFVADDL